MEASETLTPAAPAAVETPVAPAAPEAEQTPAPPQPVTREELTQLEQKILGVTDGLPSRIAEHLQQPPPESNDLSSELQRLFGGEGDPEDDLLGGGQEQDPNLVKLAQLLDERSERRFQQDAAERAAERRDDAFVDLETRIPELATPEVADRVLAEATARATALAPLLPGSDPRVLLQAAPFIELVHKAMKADAAAQAETPAGGQPAPVLEQPSGQPPPAAQPGTDRGADIVAAGKKSTFWGA